MHVAVLVSVRVRVRVRIRCFDDSVLKFSGGGYGVRVRTIFGTSIRGWVRVRVKREVFNMNDPGFELGDGVCDFEKVPPDRLCPQVLKEGEQVHTVNFLDPCSYARVSRLCLDVLGLLGEWFRDRLVDNVD